jgi:hypothetical protein
MTASRFTKVGGFCAAMLLALLVSPFAAGSAASVKDLHRYCRKVGNDDTIREYSYALRRGTVEAFRKLFPGAESTPDDSDFQAEAKYRCMDGKVMACFLGANLVCDKMNAARDNPGADDFCRENPDSDFVPLVATGHDAVYSYRCRNGKAEIAGKVWELDKRGFARKLWTELPDR